MTVHILEPDNHVFSLNRLAAMIGFHQLGEEVQLFTEEKFDALPLVSGDIVVGGVGYAQRGMRRLGLTVPILESVPLKLLPFAGRRLWRSTMAEVRARVEAGEALFAKPTPTRLKLFTGQVFSSFHDLIGTAHIADDEILDCAETIAPVSEYRAFILRGELEGLRHYKGDGWYRQGITLPRAIRWSSRTRR